MTPDLAPHLALASTAALFALTWWMGRLRCGTWAWWRDDKETSDA